MNVLETQELGCVLNGAPVQCGPSSPMTEMIFSLADTGGLVEHSVRVEGGPIPWIEIDASMWDRILSRSPEHPTSAEGHTDD